MSKVRSGVLLKKDIVDLKLISENSTDSSYKPASYDLRIGNEYINPGAGEQISSHKPLRGKKIVVEPFGSLIVSTHEVLELPANIVGKFNLRIKQALRGLFVQMGTQVEPGYHGRLFAVLNNITAEPIELDWEEDPEKRLSRERLFTIEFFTANGSVTTVQTDKNLLGIGDFVNSTRFAKSSINSVVKSVETCRTQIDQIEKRLETQEETVLEQVTKAFSGKLENLEVERASAKKVEEIQERVDKDKLTTIEAGYKDTFDRIDSFEKGIKEDRKSLYLGVLWGGLGLLFLSAMVPFFISYALDQSNSWWERGTIEAYKTEMSLLQAEIEDLKASSARNDTVDSLLDQVRSLQSTIIALEAKIEYTEAEPSAEGSPSPGEQ